MPKKKSKQNSFVIGLVIVAVVVVLGFFANYMGWLDTITGAVTGDNVDVDIDVDVTIDDGSSSGGSGGSGSSVNLIDMCGALETNYPTGATLYKAECVLATGTVICDENSFGCFDIPSGIIDTTYCGTTIPLQLKAYCTGQGGVWTCQDTEVICVR